MAITTYYTPVTFPLVKSWYWYVSFSHIFRFGHFLVCRLCPLLHILTLPVLSFQNPIYRYPYYSFVYNVGFYFTEYKLVSPSSQSSSKFHYTCSHLIIISMYSLRTIVKVLVLIILCCFLSFFIKTLSFFIISHCSLLSLITTAYLCSVGVDLEGQVTLPSTLIPPFIVLVFIGDSVICVLAGISAFLILWMTRSIACGFSPRSASKLSWWKEVVLFC